MKYWSISAKKTLEELSSNPDYGLNEQQVSDLISSHGPNEYQQSKPESVPSMVLRQFKDVANLILLLAAWLSLALAVREGHGYVEPVVILAVIAMNVILAVTQERGDERIMARRPIGRTESFFSGITRVIALQTVAFAAVGLLAFWLGAFAWLPGGEGPSLEAGQTMCFLVVAFTSVLHVFTVRTRGSVFRRTVRDNMPLVWSALGVIAAFSALVLAEPVGAVFGLAPIGPSSWACSLALSVVPTLVAEAFKLWDNRHETWLYRRRLVRHENRGEE